MTGNMWKVKGNEGMNGGGFLAETALARGSHCFEEGSEDFNPRVKFAMMEIHPWCLAGKAMRWSVGHV